MNMVPESSKDADEFWSECQQRLNADFEAGAKEAIVERTRDQLNQSKWAEDVQRRFEEHIKTKGLRASELTDADMAGLCDELRDELRRAVPAAVKQDLMAAVTDFLDEQLQDVKKSVVSG